MAEVLEGEFGGVWEAGGSWDVGTVSFPVSWLVVDPVGVAAGAGAQPAPARSSAARRRYERFICVS